MKKIVKTGFLIFEIFFLVSKSFVAATEFSNLMMFDALKRLDSFFVNFSSKRRILSRFVVFSSFSFHKDDSSFLIASLFFELIRIFIFFFLH